MNDLKITCEYCGSVIDIEKSDCECCPNCGATFKDNKQLNEDAEQQRQFDNYILEKERIETEQKRLRLERQKLTIEFQHVGHKVSKAVSVGCAIPVIIFGILIAIAIVWGVFEGITQVKQEQAYNDVNYTEVIIEEEEESPQTVNFNETAHFNKIDVIANQCEEYYYPWKKPNEGFMYVRVNLIVTNTSEESADIFENIVCTYKDGEYDVQADSPTISSSDLDTKLRGGSIEPGMSAKGFVYFVVPENADFSIKCDKMLTINIKADDCVRLADNN